MRRMAVVLLLAGLSFAGPAAARAHRTGGMHAARAPGTHAGSHRHRESSPELVGTIGPSHFHPVKPYKGFSYLEHEKHPEKD